MRVIKTTNYFFVMLSFLVAIILTIIPLPEWAVWLRPQWVFAFLLFWVIAAPSECGVGLAWLVGLMLSLVTGTPLAEQAIIFVLLTYVILKIHPIIAYMFPWQQAAVIGVFAACNAVLHGFILGFTGHSTHMGLYSLSAISTMLIWPAISAILNRLRPRAYIH